MTPVPIAESKKMREDEVRKSRARSMHLGQARGSSEREGPVSSERKDQSPPERESRAGSQEWICICKLCKLYPGRDCDVNWPRKVVAQRKGGNEEGERGELETRRPPSGSI